MFSVDAPRAPLAPSEDIEQQQQSNKEESPYLLPTSILYTMKFSLAAVFLSVMGVASASQKTVKIESGLKADSALGQHLLSKATRVLEQNEDEMEMTWVSGYSLKFQGCHHVQQVR